jgi:hypothetical protein
MKQTARGRVPTCGVQAPAELGDRRCSMAFGIGGHTLMEQGLTPLGLPVPIHQFYDAELKTWRRWVRMPHERVLSNRDAQERGEAEEGR